MWMGISTNFTPQRPDTGPGACSATIICVLVTTALSSARLESGLPASVPIRPDAAEYHGVRQNASSTMPSMVGRLADFTMGTTQREPNIHGRIDSAALAQSKERRSRSEYKSGWTSGAARVESGDYGQLFLRMIVIVVKMQRNRHVRIDPRAVALDGPVAEHAAMLLAILRSIALQRDCGATVRQRRVDQEAI